MSVPFSGKLGGVDDEIEDERRMFIIMRVLDPESFMRVPKTKPEARGR